MPGSSSNIIIDDQVVAVAAVVVASVYTGSGSQAAKPYKRPYEERKKRNFKYE